MGGTGLRSGYFQTIQHSHVQALANQSHKRPFGDPNLEHLLQLLAIQAVEEGRLAFIRSCRSWRFCSSSCPNPSFVAPSTPTAYPCDCGRRLAPKQKHQSIVPVSGTVLRILVALVHLPSAVTVTCFPTSMTYLRGTCACAAYLISNQHVRLPTRQLSRRRTGSPSHWIFRGKTRTSQVTGPSPSYLPWCNTSPVGIPTC
jgi:hypothetical protein